jgi:SAM-dependent methyltransferase
VFVPALLELLDPKSVLDVGGGTGGFVAEFRRRGVADVLGVEGAWAANAPLALPRDCFSFHELDRPLELGRTFDLVLCLEVGEHLEAARADLLVDSLTRHTAAVCFSAAVPSQGGTHHVNEQWPDYWADKFRARGFVAFDPIRPAVLRNLSVPGYYAQNTLVYAAAGSEPYRRLLRSYRPILGPISFLIRTTRAPYAWWVLNRLPNRVRKSLWFNYRTRWQRWMPPMLRDA